MYSGKTDNRVVKSIVLIVTSCYQLLLLPLLEMAPQVYCVDSREVAGTLELAGSAVGLCMESNSVVNWTLHSSKMMKYIFTRRLSMGMYTVNWHSNTSCWVPGIAHYFIWGLSIIIVNIRYVMELLKPFNKNRPS